MKCYFNLCNCKCRFKYTFGAVNKDVVIKTLGILRFRVEV